ncbi:MAG: ATP-binding cassette domain-containing protein, partial [Lentisphaerae bacterium]|nr:ATP-binding cassette domain-containing protein [Lentisphaerota bacterium]
MAIDTTNSAADDSTREAADASGERLLMSVRGLCKSFREQTVLNSLNFDLHEGEVVLLQGPNGSGKTTLVNMLTGNLVPDAGSIRLMTNGDEERFEFPRHWWQDLNPLDHFLPERVAREGVGRSWQETRLFPSIGLAENIATASSTHSGENPWNVLFRPRKTRGDESSAKRLAEERLTELGLRGRELSSGDMVSLGQAKRVAIARAVQGGARILFLDEPLSGLDAEGVKDVLGLLQKLAEQHHITLVIIEHVWNVRHILPLATTIWNLSDGRLHVDENCRAEGKGTVSDDGWAPFEALFPEFRLSRSCTIPEGAKLNVYRCGSGSADGEPTRLLQVDGLVVRRGIRPVIGQRHNGVKPSGLSFSLSNGDIAVLQAPNGWGKTTLMDALSGIIPQEQGTVTLCGKLVSDAPPWSRVQNGLAYHRSDNVGFGSLSNSEVARLTGETSGRDQDTDRKKLSECSGGERRIARLSGLLARPHQVALLDEPFSALDESHLAAVAQAIRESILNRRTAM